MTGPAGGTEGGSVAPDVDGRGCGAAGTAAGPGVLRSCGLALVVRSVMVIRVAGVTVVRVGVVRAAVIRAAVIRVGFGIGFGIIGVGVIESIHTATNFFFSGS